jgi:hypothetical protein
MDNTRVAINPFKQKGKGIKVYSSKANVQNLEEPIKPEVQQRCNCPLCRNSRGIGREVRGQFTRYGKV